MVGTGLGRWRKGKVKWKVEGWMRAVSGRLSGYLFGTFI